jgi:RNA polymerase sigma-70 factor, ECF subfamily
MVNGEPDLSVGTASGDVPDRDSDDAEILRCVAEGDDAALAELYRRHRRVVLSQILFVVGDRAVSEEILQDTMVAVWRQAGTFRGESRVRSWIIAIARRQARDRLRRNRFRVVEDSVLVNQPSSEAGPELVALERANVAEVARTIQTLGRTHREVLGLVFAADLSLGEVAAILEVPIGTVKSRLAAARTALSRALHDDERKETSQ